MATAIAVIITTTTTTTTIITIITTKIGDGGCTKSASHHRWRDRDRRLASGAGLCSAAKFESETGQVLSRKGAFIP
jgi:hypothetical protein